MMSVQKHRSAMHTSAAGHSCRASSSLLRFPKLQSRRSIKAVPPASHVVSCAAAVEPCTCLSYDVAEASTLTPELLQVTQSMLSLSCI